MKNDKIEINTESFKSLLKVLFDKCQNRDLCLKSDFEKVINLECLIDDIEDKKKIKEFINDISNQQIENCINDISRVNRFKLVLSE